MDTKIKKVFVDFHHPALYYSLYLLFEKRLGYELYRPIDEEWHYSKYWKISDLCVTNEQLDEKLKELLVRNAVPPTTTKSWNKVLEEKEDHILLDEYGGCPTKQRAVTLEQFKLHDFDILIPTFVWNINSFKKLRDQFCPSAKVIAQFGNCWDLNEYKDEYIIASVAPNVSKSDKVLFYKQEFDLNIYRPAENRPKNLLTSFVCYDDIPDDDKRNIEQLKEQLLNYNFDIKIFGKHSPDGFIENQQKIAAIMRDSKFGIQIKSVGDGYGHVLHQWFASGRPVIYRGSFYKGTLGEALLHHGETGFDLDKMELKDILNKIHSISETEYNSLCSNVRKVFSENVDFNSDAFRIKEFLEKI